MGFSYRDENGAEYYDPEMTQPIVPLVKFKYPNLSGRAKRKLLRRNTVHLRGICPKCGKIGMRWHKDIPTNRYNNGKRIFEHNKWVCKSCNFITDREGLKYVKYE